MTHLASRQNQDIVEYAVASRMPENTKSRLLQVSPQGHAGEQKRVVAVAETIPAGAVPTVGKNEYLFLVQSA